MFYSLDELTLTFPKKRGLIPQGRMQTFDCIEFCFQNKIQCNQKSAYEPSDPSGRSLFNVL